MKGPLWIFLFSFFTACGYGIATKPVSIDTFLNDNSSKVWLVKAKYVNGALVETERSGFREVFIFYRSTKVIIQPLNTLGNFPNNVGYYVLSDDNQKITFEIGKEKWTFQIASYSEQQVVLKGLKGKRANQKLVLIPLPEEF